MKMKNFSFTEIINIQGIILELLKKTNSNLPKEECQKLLKKTIEAEEMFFLRKQESLQKTRETLFNLVNLVNLLEQSERINFLNKIVKLFL